VLGRLGVSVPLIKANLISIGRNAIFGGAYGAISGGVSSSLGAAIQNFNNVPGAPSVPQALFRGALLGAINGALTGGLGGAYSKGVFTGLGDGKGHLIGGSFLIGASVHALAGVVEGKPFHDIVMDSLWNGFWNAGGATVGAYQESNRPPTLSDTTTVVEQLTSVFWIPTANAYGDLLRDTYTYR
jgi:hypothetical protein